MFLHTALIGLTYTMPSQPGNTDYKIVGYADTGTLLVVGAFFDAPNNRTRLVTHKVTEIHIKGQIP